MSEQKRAKRLEGKVAIVTGAGRGIGRCEALLLAAEGAKVLVNDVYVENRGGADEAKIAERVVVLPSRHPDRQRRQCAAGQYL